MRMIARGDLFAMEVLADTSACAQPFTKIRSEIKKQLRTIGIEVVFQTKNIYSRSKRLIVFDVDGNAFSSSFAETTNTNLPAIGFQPKVLAGLSINLIRRLASECRPSFATVELVRTLQMMGYRVALLSSGLEPFLSSLAAQLGVDYILGNKLDIRGKKVTGSLIKPLVTHKKQQEYINKIRRQERLQSGEVVVIGKEKPGIPKSGLNFRYQGVLVNTAIANGDLRPEQAASIAAQFQTSKPVKKEV